MEWFHWRGEEKVFYEEMVFYSAGFLKDEKHAMKRINTHSKKAFVIAGTISVFFLAGRGRTSQPGAVVLAQSEPAALIAAPGRVEPISEEVKVGDDYCDEEFRSKVVRISQALGK